MKKTILFQGDSITDCDRVRTNITSMGTGYANMVKGNLGCERPGEFEFINKAASGSNVVDVYSRVKSEIINLKPDYMSLLIGVNDVWHELGGRCNGVAAEKYEKILKDIKLGKVEVWKEYYGMSTKKAQARINPNAELKTSEGFVKRQKVEYSIKQWVENEFDYLRSVMSYTNSKTLNEYKNSKWVINTYRAYND